MASSHVTLVTCSCWSASINDYLHSIEDLHALFSTCRTLYRTCSNPDPKVVPRLAANSGRVFFRPHPHLLIAATARQVADWAVQSGTRRGALETAIQNGMEKLLEFMIDVAELTVDDIRKLHAFKCDVLNPLSRQLDLDCGPASEEPMTVCNDPETTLVSWIIYGELFHHSLELAIIRYKWLVYCVPDVNSFNYMGFEDQPAFFKAFVQADDDRFQQLSMSEAIHKQLHFGFWMEALQAPPRSRWFAICVMHMGFKGLKVLVPGGPERLSADLQRVESGMVDQADDATKQRLLAFVGDPGWRLGEGFANGGRSRRARETMMLSPVCNSHKTSSSQTRQSTRPRPSRTHPARYPVSGTLQAHSSSPITAHQRYLGVGPPQCPAAERNANPLQLTPVHASALDGPCRPAAHTDDPARLDSSKRERIDSGYNKAYRAGSELELKYLVLTGVFFSGPRDINASSRRYETNRFQLRGLQRRRNIISTGDTVADGRRIVYVV
ncbi:hypothetical protein B0H10DRAFT_1940868 [Mycena sp. CBHHK59/15]|nr:hypothetical protein B0H10DRAFT_1940868 [Mycena sp. CBHHK59/15]